MSLPDFSMRQLLESGAHFGHQSHRWNPKMAPYIYGDPQQHPHHRSRPDRAAAAPGAEDRVRHRRQGRPRAVRRHQAPGVRGDRRGRQALGAIFRQRPLARRHADQLEDHFRLDHAAAQARRNAWRGRARPDQEGAPDAVARAREAGDGARRHQGHGRHARSGFRDRHQQGAIGDQGGQSAQASRSSPSSTPTAIPTASPIPIPANDDAGPRDPALLRSRRARGDRRHFAQPGRDAASMSAPPRRRSPRRCAAAGRAARPRRPSGSNCSPRRAARPTISPSCTASARRSSRSSTSTAFSIIGRSPR